MSYFMDIVPEETLKILHSYNESINVDLYHEFNLGDPSSAMLLISRPGNGGPEEVIEDVRIMRALKEEHGIIAVFNIIQNMHYRLTEDMEDMFRSQGINIVKKVIYDTHLEDSIIYVDVDKNSPINTARRGELLKNLFKCRVKTRIV